MILGSSVSERGVDHTTEGAAANGSGPTVHAKRRRETLGGVRVSYASSAKGLRSCRYRAGVSVPPDGIVQACDFVLIHGNGVGDPGRIRSMVDQCRALPGYRDQPIVFNEDDHFGFDDADNNMLAAVSRYASWGYFDYRMAGEGHDEGYQSVPVNWGISSRRKRGFFRLLADLTGSTP